MITSDQINYLIARYLDESGFKHTLFNFIHESGVYNKSTRGSQLKTGALINILQKGLQYLECEVHINPDGSEKKCDAPFNLLEQHVCSTTEPVKEPANKKARREEAAPSVPKKDRKDDKKGAKADREKRSKKDDPMDVVEDISIDEMAVSRLSNVASAMQCTWNPAKTQVIAIGGGDGRVRLLQVPTKPGNQTAGSEHELAMPENTPKPSAGCAISALEWAPSGALLAAGTVDGRTLVWTRSGELKFCEQQHTGAIHALAWSPSGTFIATGCHDKMSVVWDVASGQVRQKFDFHDGPVLTADWLNDSTLATASLDKQIYICAMGDIEPLKQFSHSAEIHKISWDQSKSFLASCSEDGTAKVWTMKQDDAIFTAKGHDKDVVTCFWCPNSERLILATASADHTLRLWDVNKQDCLHTFRNHDAKILDADFTPNGRYLASVSIDGRVNVWSMKDRTLIKTYQSEKSEAMAVRWNKHGEKLAIINNTMTVCGV
ncbi:WD40-repeat-containing domain protein [Powellomyces hirtus]|nr:WD40-repeat-containing domain protein [Powellomyces hirtus]